jgi:hypothetical protein
MLLSIALELILISKLKAFFRQYNRVNPTAS